jgi:uncharacterized protein
MNRLDDAKSPYLRHAADQKIDWYSWAEEPFERAKKEDKPVFLSTGAVWCHWCHVMAKECFEDDEIAGLLNKNFICIKLDRDEMPSIDRRYQQAVTAMGSGGGWPLSVFLTHEKKPFFGGTYFPPEDMHGRPGFKKVLREVASLYRTKKEEISAYTDKLMDFIKPGLLPGGNISRVISDKAIKIILAEYDSQNGGFGTAPKFPMPGALEFMISRYFFSRDESIADSVSRTLKSMAKGGFHDQLGGGFHRYSTDAAWIIPHFEKMAEDNAWLLRNYIDAYAIFKDDKFRKVAEGIISFIGNVLSDPEGGYYASQDADVAPEDEGGYFLWTNEDFRKILDDDEYRIMSLYLFDERGSMPHDESKRVLFEVVEEKEIGRLTGFDLEKVRQIIKSAKEKLLEERNKRETPFIDRTLYTSLNGMLIASCLKAFRTLKDRRLKDFALKSLERITASRYSDSGLFHSEGVKAVLDDYIFLIEALVSAYEITGDRPYLDQADELMELCIKKLWDHEDGGFFDSEDALLGIRLKGIQDIPHPSANSVGTRLLLKLCYMTGKESYCRYAETALKAFSKTAELMGVHAGYYYSALDEYFYMLKLTLKTDPDSGLAETARSCFRPYMSLVYDNKNEGFVLPCSDSTCFDPITTPEALAFFLAEKT